MSEPEDILLDGAHFVAEAVASLWRRNRVGPATVELAEVRGHLELLTVALFPASPPITVAEPPARPTPLARWVRRIPRSMVESRALPSTDGRRLRLPASLEAPRGRAETTTLYRLFAVEQAARADRGTPASLPGRDELLVRDLYWLAEATAVDAWLVRSLPGWSGALGAARSRALAHRPSPVRPTPLERWVDELAAELLRRDPGSPPSLLRRAVEASWTPADSLDWAHRRAKHLARVGGRYRGVRAAAIWGVPTELGAESSRRIVAAVGSGQESLEASTRRVGSMRRRPRVREDLEDEDDEHAGMWAVQLDDPQEHVEDPMGLQRPTDRDERVDSDDLADSLSELPEARLVPVPGSPTELLVSPDPPGGRAACEDPTEAAVGVLYPEWDYRIDAYRSGHVVVAVGPAREGEPEWSARILTRHAADVRRVRRTFERLRPRRQRLGRQLDGADLDLEAYVSSWATARAGGPFDQRLYESVRPRRRELAITLLVDVSGSTDSWVAGARRIVDVEKEALLLVCEGLDALGDRYNVLAFSGEGPRGVSVTTVKTFHGGDRGQVRRRIAALQPDRYTRLGAAIRHASSLLSQEAAVHRLLLVLSDGKPNDVDLYEGQYGVEDARQAVAEARLQAIHPFCLTVDREAPAYLPRLFGPTGFAVLHDPVRLPGVLVEVVQRLIRT